MDHVDIALFERVLIALAPLYKEAAVVGGAVRDFYIGRPRKDIDVMVMEPFSPLEMIQDLSDILPDHGFRVAGTLNPSYCGLALASDPHLVGVVSTDFKCPTSGEEHRVQIVGLRMANWSTKEAIERCDFGLCMAGYSLDAGLVFSQQFLQDVRDFTLTLHRAETYPQLAYSRRRAKRLIPALSQHYGTPWSLVDGRPQDQKDAAPLDEELQVAA